MRKEVEVLSAMANLSSLPRLAQRHSVGRLKHVDTKRLGLGSMFRRMPW